jgi:hypothetical protein
MKFGAYIAAHQCDVNGDGRNDLLEASRIGALTMEAHIIFGGSIDLNTPDIYLANLTSKQLLTIEFINNAGYSTQISMITCLGDINGDGADEIGLYGIDSGPVSSLWVVYGVKSPA